MTNLCHPRTAIWLKVILTTILLGGIADVYAQSKAMQKAVQRYEIDAKRMGVDVNSNDALPRSREFLRIDSTYYVGWMFEGVYKFNHAADYLGFKNAAVPLERALSLLERDYKPELRTRTPELIKYFPVYKYHLDYTLTAYFLMTCYANTEEPEKVVALLRRVLQWKFQRDFYLDAYNYLAWTVHRYRFYNNGKYSFLANSIDANEKLAMSYLDSGLMNIQRNKKFNSAIFQPGYEKLDNLSVYHYKCILYSYAFNIDSSEYYFGLMRENNALPHNNYGNFKSICGEFRDAETEYKKAAETDTRDKRLQEWAYYSSILDIYKAKPREAADLSRQMIQAAGSTPGFGWYNIALARALHYDGQISESERYIDKAAEFKELHIGTTLGQSHYDFSIQLLKLINKERRFAMQRFEHRNWWYNPAVLGNMAGLVAEKYLQQYLIINQFAQNPERDRVIYKLFSSESTVSWDEIWYLVKDFSTGYFIKRFQREVKENKRGPVTKYFQLFIARLQMAKGNYGEARQLLHQVLQDSHTDPEYEQLFMARTYQALAACYSHENDEKAAAEWTNRLYRIYPQLIPFTELTMNMQLHISGNPDTRVLERVRECNINFEKNAANAVHATLSFSSKGSQYKVVSYKVTDAMGKELVPQQSFTYRNPEEAGVTLAYRLFNVGGGKMPDEKEKK